MVPKVAAQEPQREYVRNDLFLYPTSALRSLSMGASCEINQQLRGIKLKNELKTENRTLLSDLIQGSWLNLFYESANPALRSCAYTPLRDQPEPTFEPFPYGAFIETFRVDTFDDLLNTMRAFKEGVDQSIYTHCIPEREHLEQLMKHCYTICDHTKALFPIERVRNHKISHPEVLKYQNGTVVSVQRPHNKKLKVWPCDLDALTR